MADNRDERISSEANSAPVARTPDDQLTTYAEGKAQGPGVERGPPPKEDPAQGKSQYGFDSVARQVDRRRQKLKQWFERTPPGRFAIAAVLGIAVGMLLRVLGFDNWVVSVTIFLTLVAVCLLLFKLGPYFQSEFARSVRAMWMPLALTIGAAVLLFYEGQGRDLGVGLLGENFLQLFLLCPILVYWGVNNWHSARIGLNYEFKELTGNERWVFWLPRLLGVCAHLFAAFSLSFAAWNTVTAAGAGPSALTLSNCFVFTAPVIIALVTLAMWSVDVAYISESRAKPLNPNRAKQLFRWVAACSVALWLALGALEFYGLVPEGLALATLSISVSAVIFLGLVSNARKKFDRTPVSHARLTGILAVPAVLIMLVVWFAPTLVGSALGSLNVCFFAFGAVLAVINGIGWFGNSVVDMDVRAERFKFTFQCVLFLLLLASLTSIMRPFHRVRLCEVEACQAAPLQSWSPIAKVGDRPSIHDAALAWYEQANKTYHEGNKNSGKAVPMLIVASAGGGIRAAYWTATVLERLQGDLASKGQALDKQTFAISGVSGGSVGAMDYIAARHFGDNPTTYLQSDFLAPAIASLVFTDGVSNFLPDFGQIDRGAALERSLERGSKNHLAYSFLSFFPRTADLSTNWRPALLLNATHQETGRRIIASNLKIEKDTFLDSFDELDVLASDMRASTAAHNSARFTYVSPAGKLLARVGEGKSAKFANRGYVIDGGYFENYGALTALELARSARDEIKRANGSVKLVILQISSDPTLTKGRTRVRTLEAEDSCSLVGENLPGTAKGEEAFLRFNDARYNPDTWRWENNDGEGLVVSYLNELAAPLFGVTAVREARGRLAAAELASAVCAERNAIKAAPSQPAQAQQPAAINDLLIGKADPAGRAGQMQPSMPSQITSGEAPHFAHLAMCQVSENNKAPIAPPLGWVLSEPLRKKFSEIFDDCENQSQLSDLEAALE